MRQQGRRNRGVVVIAASVALALAVIMSPVAARIAAAQLTEAELFFELNDTDGDLGIHASIDGEPWVTLEIEGPDGRKLLTITAQGRLSRQGLTQVSLESAEPSFDELLPQQFFDRFPEGTYEIEITTRNNQEFERKVTLSHVLAAPPSGILVAGIPAAENCDAVALPTVPAGMPVTIDWAPVTTSHPTIGKAGPVEIVRYQFFVEQGDLKFGIDLPPAVTEFVIPAMLLAAGEVKFEIIARTATGNNTAVESCFVVE
jgi:hypothetical protein